MADPIFQRSLQDLIKGIRTHKKDPSAFISQTIAEIKTELRSTDPFLKAEAVRKLTYLQMVGYNVSWASFSIVEVMSQPRFAHKRIGYLAANQTFDETTDVILLTTNLFKKEFSSNSSSSQYEVGLAVNCLANIATKELARDCISDLVLLMNHSRPYIRKKAILAMYKLYVKFPQGLRLTFDKLNDRLDDAETSVVSTAVNVICELANKNPKNYLAMAPKFFRLLTTSANNWMLIKVVKLLGSLVSEEPRLARKLLEPLATIIENTSAKSLQYECIYTITEALPYTKREDGSDAKNAAAVISLCSSQLRKLIEESDQNLKYLGLMGLCNLLKSSPRSVVEHRDIILSCLNDDDITIRTKALELLAGIVSKKSLVDLVHHLMQHAKKAEGFYRDEIISKILMMCRRDKYSMVNDFAWYISILLDLAVMPGAKHGNEVAEQLMEISLRVDSVRPFAVETMLSMLFNESAVLGSARSTVVEVLKAAAWIVGEYSDIVSLIANDTAGDDEDGDDEEDSAFWIEGALGEEIRSLWRGQHVHLHAVETLFHPRTTTFSSAVQNVYLQSALKLFVRACLDCDFHEVADIIGVLRDGLPLFLQNIDLEVQERASTYRHLLAEFQILPLNWEESSDLVKKEQSIDGDKNATNLLDLTPVFTSSSVRTIDENGARMAMQKKAALTSLLNEKFYAVHSKAQKRVPVPDNLNIEEAFNSSALNKLMNVDIPQQLNLASLTLIKEQIPKWSSSNGFSSTSIPSLALDDDYNSKFSRPLQEEEGSPLPLTTKFAELGYKPAVRTAEEEVFMLSSKKHDDILPLSKILGEQFEEIPSRKSRKKDHKKGSKGKKKSSAEVNFQEMLPAGALSSDDEGGHTKGKRNHKRAPKTTNRLLDPEDADDLQAVDITTPLREDEVLTVPTHRVVPTYTINHEQNTETREKSHKKDKKDKKDKSLGSKKDKKKKDKIKDTESADLLTLDWQPSPTPSPAPLISNNNQPDFIGLTSSPNLSPVPTLSSSGAIDQKKAPSSSGHHYYSIAFSGRQCEVAYHVTSQDQNITLHWRVTNHSPESAYVTVTAQIQACQSIKEIIGGKSIEICRNIGTNATSKASSTTFVLTEALYEAITIPVSITVSASSAQGPQINLVNIGLKVHGICSNQSYKLDENEFMEKMSKSSSKWASASLQIPCSLKAKHAFKSIANFLHAHLVETESSKACSMSAKTASGCKLFVLAKSISGANAMNIDVKCLGSSQQLSKDTAMATIAALKDIQL